VERLGAAGVQSAVAFLPLAMLALHDASAGHTLLADTRAVVPVPPLRESQQLDQAGDKSLRVQIAD
jgi:hypothetical protein